ncbi:MAG: monovalent cation/H(+) antiporter subunit G [Hyphomicrobiaceae bacterium]|nr:monovalent cation/H(+) antiporter subunit G [Hyphomicrobiaceae bacterium]
MEMIAPLRDAASWILICTGSFVILTGAIGMLRMPDVFTRMHAASLIDSLGAALLILGLMLQAPGVLVALKLAFVLALLFFLGPVVTHALAQAALGQLDPMLDEDRRAREPPSALPGRPADEGRPRA